MNRWSVSQTSFDQFLAVLDDDRDQAGRKYEALRNRMVKFFEWRACRFADQLADESIDRLIRKVEAGEKIKNIANYAYGICRLVYLESLKRPSEDDIDRDFAHPANDEENELRVACLEKCLAGLPTNSRAMILGYYHEDKQAKIDHRKVLADRFRVSLNALRIKALRIRTALEDCVLRCAERSGG